MITRKSQITDVAHNTFIVDNVSLDADTLLMFLRIINQPIGQRLLIIS